MTERRAENCTSRHGYVVLSCSRVVPIWMVIDDDVHERANSKIVQRLRLGISPRVGVGHGLWMLI